MFCFILRIKIASTFTIIKQLRRLKSYRPPSIFNMIVHYYKNWKLISEYFPKEKFYRKVFYAITTTLSDHNNQHPIVDGHYKEKYHSFDCSLAESPSDVCKTPTILIFLEYHTSNILDIEHLKIKSEICFKNCRYQLLYIRKRF